MDDVALGVGSAAVRVVLGPLERVRRAAELVEVARVELHDRDLGPSSGVELLVLISSSHLLNMLGTEKAEEVIRRAMHNVQSGAFIS